MGCALARSVLDITFFGTHLDLLPQAPAGAIPMRRRICVYMFCVRPFGAISINFDPKVLKMAQNRSKFAENDSK